jgi:antirestriction protein ArdC
MRRDIYADVSARIVAQLERGAAPWVKPWSATPGQSTPQNAISNRPYSGCNVICGSRAIAAVVAPLVIRGVRRRA